MWNWNLDKGWQVLSSASHVTSKFMDTPASSVCRSLTLETPLWYEWRALLQPLSELLHEGSPSPLVNPACKLLVVFGRVELRAVLSCKLPPHVYTQNLVTGIIVTIKYEFYLILFGIPTCDKHGQYCFLPLSYTIISWVRVKLYLKLVYNTVSVM